MKNQIILIGAGLFLLTGCGIAKLAEDTRDGVKDSNDKQEQLLKEIRTTVAETKRVRELTAELVEGMKKTNEGVHLQILTQALQGLLSKDSTELLMPPVRMMPFAEVFTREATSNEILEVVHTLVTEVLVGFDKTEKGDKRIRSRMIALTAASALAAFTPKEKSDEIFRVEIEQKGVHEDTTYVFGLCRYNFTRDYFLKSILGASTVNIDSLRKAVKYHAELKSLAARPYADRFKIKAEQLVEESKDAYQDLIDALKTTEPKLLGKSAVRRFEHPDNGLKTDVLSTQEAKDLLTKLQ